MKDQLQVLFEHILKTGFRKSDRTGVGTISTFGYQCRFDLREGFPIVTTKKTLFKPAATELIWMLGGWMKEERYKGIQRTNILFLLDNDCHIWTEWPYKAYVNKCKHLHSVGVKYSKYLGKDLDIEFSMKEFEQQIINNHYFAREFGDLGPVYQKQWRDFEGKREAVDQLLVMINKLKSNPDDRRNLTSFWNPTELDQMLLPPCHLFHQVWTRELTYSERFQLLVESNKPNFTALHDRIEEELDQNNDIPKRALSLQMYQRSSDCFLGVPFDWVFYALLIHMLAQQCNMAPGELIWTSGDTHLYMNSLDQARLVMEREPYPYPNLIIKRKPENIEDYKIDDFEFDNYQHHPFVKVQVAV